MFYPCSLLHHMWELPQQPTERKNYGAVAEVSDYVVNPVLCLVITLFVRYLPSYLPTYQPTYRMVLIVAKPS